MISNRLLHFVEGQYRGMPFELLAIGVVADGGYVTFHDTVRQRCFEGHVEKETPDGFVWHRKCTTLEGFDLDAMYVFRVLTVKEYDRKVRPKVSGNPPRFRSDAELHEYYRRTFLGPGVVEWDLLQEVKGTEPARRHDKRTH